jgi:hypothetical protein
MSAPAWLPFDVLGASAIVIIVVLVAMNRALARWNDRGRATVVRITAAALLGWLAIAIAVAASGFYRAGRVPTLQFGILVPVAAGGLVLWRSRIASRVIDAVPQSWIVGVQAYRVLGVTFVVLGALGELPHVFAWPAGFGDMAVGLLAAALVTWRHTPRSATFAWNVIGLADFAVAMTTGFLSTPTAFQRFAFDHPNELITTFPLVLIPTFIVPVSILLHVVSLMKLHRSLIGHGSSPLRERAIPQG